VCPDRGDGTVTVSVRFGSGFRIILIVIALGALFGAGVASAASPTEISSCTTLNDSGVYELVDSQTTSDSCISINASDVVFDGNGHQIGGGDPAIHVMPGVSNVTVRNVTVYSSYDGVYVEEATDVTIEDVTTRGNYRGIQIEDSSDVTIRTVDHQYDEYYGIRAEESQNVSVEGVTTSLSSGEGFGSAVIYFDSSNGSIVESDLTAGEYGQGIELRYSHQTVLDNVTANATDDYYTLEVYRSDDVVVRNSAFGGSPDEDTVYIDDSPNIQLLNTSIDDGDIGLYISGSPNATMREVSIDNSTYGLYISGDYGKFEAKASPFRAGMKPTNSIQPPTMA
jgi:nitrous oxidase accessory protein NosD